MTWMLKATAIIVLIVFLSVHGVTAYLAVVGKITGEMYLGTWGSIAGTAVGGLLVWLSKQAPKE